MNDSETVTCRQLACRHFWTPETPARCGICDKCLNCCRCLAKPLRRMWKKTQVRRNADIRRGE